MRLRRAALLTAAGSLALVVSVYAALAGARAVGFGVVVALDGDGDAVRAGELLIGREIAAADVRPGHVVVVQRGRGRGSSLAVRRVSSVHDNYGETAIRTIDLDGGSRDPNLYALADHVVAPSHTIPYAGFAAGAFTSPLGWLLFLGLPASVLAFLALRQLWLPPGA